MYVIRKWPQLHSIVNVLLTLSVCYKEVAGAYLSVRIVRYLSFYVTYLRHRSWIQATWYVQCMLYKSFWLPYKTQSLLVLNNVFVVLVQLQHGMWCLDVYRCNFEVCRKSGHVHFCILFNNNNIIKYVFRYFTGVKRVRLPNVRWPIVVRWPFVRWPIVRNKMSVKYLIFLYEVPIG